MTLCSIGIKINTPSITEPAKKVTLFIPIKCILKVLVNFHKSLPVLFIYVMPSAGSYIRKELNMPKGSEPYFDPVSRQDPHKRITLLPDVISDDVKNVIQNIFSKTFNKHQLLQELTTIEANDILIRTCPRDTLRRETPLFSNNK